MASILLGLFYGTLNFTVLGTKLSLFELWIVIEVITAVFYARSLLSDVKLGVSSEGLVKYYLIQSRLSMVLLLFLLLHGAGLETFAGGVACVLLFAKIGMLPFGF